METLAFIHYRLQMPCLVVGRLCVKAEPLQEYGQQMKLGPM